MKNRIYQIFIAFIALCISLTSHAEFNPYFKISPIYTVTCHQLTGVWKGKMINLEPDMYKDNNIKIAFYAKGNKVIGRIVYMEKNSDMEGISGQIWALCKKGILYDIHFPIQRLNLNHMPKYSDKIQSPPADNSTLLKNNHLLLHMRTCTNMGGVERTIAILKKVSDSYPYKLPTKENSYIFPKYSQGFRESEDGCNNEKNN